MKNNRMKLLALLISVTMLLTIAVSGTVAFLADNSGPVENVFTPAKVDTEITEEFDGNTKTTVIISNAADSIDVYVRVAVIGNWVKDGKVVGAWTPSSDNYPFNTADADDWFVSGNYYYYKYVVAPRTATTNLLNSNGISTSTREDGAHLEITVVHQSIQAQPKTAVTEAWGETIAKQLLNTTKPATKP